MSKGRFSETASAHRQSEGTPAETRLTNAVSNLRSVPFKYQEYFSRPGQFTHDGKPKSYKVDNLLFPQAPRKVALETEGRGTSSDDPERDELLMQVHSTRVVHIPNPCAVKYSYVLADLIDALWWALTVK